jgi:acetyl-CoA carboxylase biotin carboxyl carrier protein
VAEIAVRSEVAGVVSRIGAAPGDRVAPESEIVIVEAMKMELPVVAGASGVVSAILVELGDTIAEGQAVARITVGPAAS